MEWSDKQAKVFSVGTTEDCNLLVESVAGSGKTTTAVELATRIVDNLGKRVLFLAFNNHIVGELREKVPSRYTEGKPKMMTVLTCHSFGLRILKGNRMGKEVKEKKYYYLTRYMSDKWEDVEPYNVEKVIARVAELADLGRLNLCENATDIFEVAAHHSVGTENDEHLKAWEVILAGRKDTSTIDFTDMIYLPIYYNLRSFTYPVVIIDECVDGNSIINTKRGEVPIKDVQVGDVVQSLDESTNQIVWDVVVNKWNKGTKRVIKITTSNGKVVRCTDNHKILTNLGWLYAGKLMDLIHKQNGDVSTIKLYCNDDQIERTDGIGVYAGGHVHGHQVNQIPKGKDKARNVPKGLRHDEIQAAGRLGHYSNQEGEECGLRTMELAIPNHIGTRTPGVCQPVHVHREEESNQRVVESVDPRGFGVLVYGRWFNINQQIHETGYPFLRPGGIEHNPAIFCGYGNTDIGEVEEGEIPSIAHQSGGEGQAPGHDAPMGHRIHAIQVPGHGASKNLPTLPEHVRNYEQPACLLLHKMWDGLAQPQGQAEQSGEKSHCGEILPTLPKQIPGKISGTSILLDGMQREVLVRKEGQESEDGYGQVSVWNDISEKKQQPHLLLKRMQARTNQGYPGPCATQQEMPPLPIRLQTTTKEPKVLLPKMQEPGRVPEEKAGGASGETLGIASSMPVLWDGFCERVEGTEVLFTGMPVWSTSEGGSSQVSPVEVSIVSIDWDGESEVYDIETANTHAFFANGILVHNCQDLSAAQRAIMHKATHKSGKFIAFGDRAQAINGFAGADESSFMTLRNTPNTKLLPLSTCYRCGSDIVKEASAYVPQIEAAEWAPTGQIVREDSIYNVRPGDMVLCRNNYPLIRLCLKYWSEGVRAYVKGNDVGMNLISLIRRNLPGVDRKKKLPTGPIYLPPGMVNRIDILYNNMQHDLDNYANQLAAKYGIDKSVATKTQAYSAMSEKVDSIMIIARGCETIPDIAKKIESIFSNVDDSNAITLSSIHRSKGLENERVFIVNWNLIPSKFATEEWMLQQEYNLAYVAITRAKRYLGFVTDFDAYDKKNGDDLI